MLLCEGDQPLGLALRAGVVLEWIRCIWAWGCMTLMMGAGVWVWMRWQGMAWYVMAKKREQRVVDFSVGVGERDNESYHGMA